MAMWMRSVSRLAGLFVVYVLACILQKPVFLLLAGASAGSVAARDYIDVICHGLPMDMAVAAYFTAIPGVLTIIGSFLDRKKVLSIISKVYFGIAAIALSATAVLNLGLYPHWQFPLDATPLFYFTSSPSAAMASVTPVEAVAGTVAFALYALAIYLSTATVFKATAPVFPAPWRERIFGAVAALVCTALLFIPMRGGLTVSTMNLSRSYYSNNKFLNHAAVNPFFSLLYSLSHQTDFGSQFRYMPDSEADDVLAGLEHEKTGELTADSIPLLDHSRPDIYLVILESFSSHLVPSLGGDSIAMALDSMGHAGVMFSDVYASSFRTDRALPAILGAFPAQPTTSLMKFVEKTEGLPSLPRSLAENGWTPRYYYGGDINFTNMLAYLVNCGFDESDIVRDKDFPLSQRTGKWGVHDGPLAERVIADIQRPDIDTIPRFAVIQTSSSHEPFEVPDFHRSDIPEVNAFAYTDSCLGALAQGIERLSPRPYLIVAVPDHYGAWPRNLTSPSARHHIPLVMCGSALSDGRKGTTISKTASQTDIAATLLNALGIPANQFTYSRDILSTTNAGTAFFSSPTYIAASDSTGTTAIDIESGELIEGDSIRAVLPKAFYQKLYDTLDSL